MFAPEGEFLSAAPLGSGHINDTYLVSTSTDKYVLQKINHNIFPEVEKMNDNIDRALTHLFTKQLSGKEQRFKNLAIIFCKNGLNHFRDKDGNYWRMMNFVSNSVSYDVAKNPEIAFEAAKSFGYFQKKLSDLNPNDFFPVIKDFHNLEMRMKLFKDIVANNSENRNQFAAKEIEFVKTREHLSIRLKDLLESGKIPVRVTHNDTKINNVLLDKVTLKGIAVVDLDTIMPGTALFDFGDMVRTFTSPAEEDEKDLSKVSLRLEIFEAIASGYLSELKDLLTKTEINNLVFGGKLMTFMIGLRFLTDYLQGDVYFKTSREKHNLDRCRTQFKLLMEIEEKENTLQKMILAQATA
jgi:hypothetical protein